MTVYPSRYLAIKNLNPDLHVATVKTDGGFTNLSAKQFAEHRKKQYEKRGTKNVDS